VIPLRDKGELHASRGLAAGGIEEVELLEIALVNEEIVEADKRWVDAQEHILIDGFTLEEDAITSTQNGPIRTTNLVGQPDSRSEVFVIGFQSAARWCNLCR
jgi:hypothetical protein